MKKTTVDAVRLRHARRDALIHEHDLTPNTMHEDVGFLLDEVSQLLKENENLRKSIGKLSKPRTNKKLGRGKVKTVGRGTLAKSSRWKEVK